MINVVFEGLGFTDMLNGEEVCFDNIEKFLWYGFYFYDGFAMVPVETYNATLSFTKMMGMISPVCRTCYSFSEENQQNWLLLGKRLFSVENLYLAIKRNLISSYSTIDSLSWGSYVKFKKKKWLDASYDLSKMINLMII